MPAEHKWWRCENLAPCISLAAAMWIRAISLAAAMWIRAVGFRLDIYTAGVDEEAVHVSGARHLGLGVVKCGCGV